MIHYDNNLSEVQKEFKQIFNTLEWNEKYTYVRLKHFDNFHILSNRKEIMAAPYYKKEEYGSYSKLNDEEKKKKSIEESLRRTGKNVKDIIYANLHSYTVSEVFKNKKYMFEYINKMKKEKGYTFNVNTKIKSTFLTFVYYKEKAEFDFDAMSRDFKLFIKKMNYYLKIKLGYKNNIRYVASWEKHKEGNNPGSFHLHVIFFDMVFIPISLLNKFWIKGNINIEIIGDKDYEAQSRYVTKYITKSQATEYINKKRYFASRSLMRLKKLQNAFDETENKNNGAYIIDTSKKETLKGDVIDELADFYKKMYKHATKVKSISYRLNSDALDCIVVCNEFFNTKNIYRTRAPDWFGGG